MIPTCTPPEPPPVLFEEVDPHSPLVLELRRVDADLLAALDARRIPATLVLTPEEARAAGEAGLRGHELALDLQTGVSPEQLKDWPMESWKELGRKQLKAFRKASGARPHTVRVDAITARGELALSQLGVTTLLVDSPGRPHLATRPDGMHTDMLVLPLGSYQCEQLEGWSLDRVAEASEAGMKLGLPAVRVVVDEQPTEVLMNWLDDAWLRVGGLVARADEIPPALPDPAALKVLPGRRVDRSELLLAAEILAGGGRLPRTLPGDLTLTEAFLGLCLLLAEEQTREEVVLNALEPPGSQATSSTPRPVSAQDVRAAAVRLSPALTVAIPGIVDVGDQTLTAAEFLAVMARLLVEPDAQHIEVPTTESPAPYAAGLGWGLSR